MEIEEIINDLIKKEEIEWEDIVDNLIEKKIIDPLNVDLEVFIEYYIKTVRELRKRENFDFILTSKVLFLLVFFLKLKIEYLSKIFLEEENDREKNEEEFIFEEYEEENKKIKRKKKEEKKLEFIIKLERKRKVDLEDLKSAIREALKEYEEKKKRLKKKKVEKELEDLHKLEYDIEKEIEILSEKLEKIRKKIIEFNFLLRELNRKERKEEIIKTFMPLLYLDNDGKIFLKQLEHFGRIFIVKDREIQKEDLEKIRK